MPEEALATEIRNGHLDRALALPMEDLYANGYPAGAVGQEVYGAGTAFAFVTRAFRRLPRVPFLLYCDYPLAEIRHAGRLRRSAASWRLPHRLPPAADCRRRSPARRHRPGRQYGVGRHTDPGRPSRVHCAGRQRGGSPMAGAAGSWLTPPCRRVNLRYNLLFSRKG